MSKINKLIRKFCTVPPPRDFTWDELVTMLGHLGWKVLEGKGSHRVFYNVDLDHYIRGGPKPHPGNEVRVCYIKSVKSDLLLLGVIKDE